MRPRITGWGKYVPSKVLTNQGLEKTLDTSDEWIVSRTGIRERRIAADHESASSMAIQAAREALRVARLDPPDVDLLILATSTPDTIVPSCASLVQCHLGAEKAAAFDINAACTGFLYGLATAYQFIETGVYRSVLVIGSEVYSRILDWSDRTTCILFGDGAGAVVVQGGAEDAPLGGRAGKAAFVLGSDGSNAHLLRLPGIAKARVAAEGLASTANGSPYLVMEGQKVFKLAVTAMIDAARQAIEKAELTPAQVDLFIPHQANVRIIDAATRALDFPSEKVFVNVEKYGNTASASIPIALCEAVEQGRLHPGDNLLLVGFGGGLTWGAAALQWDSLAAALP
jgi:3-oxoacyl-[acyl-carrier-protein] synthase-3